MGDTAVELAPISAADLVTVGRFLHEHLNHRLTAQEWTRSIVPTWAVDAPNHGFLLRAGTEVVGVQLAFYAEREIDGRSELFCNLGAWCVLETYRAQGLRLLRAVLAQRQYHFTDLSPSGNVVPLNQRLGFTQLDTTTALVPHRPALPGRATRVISDEVSIEWMLTGTDRKIFLDHRQASAAIHLVLVRGTEHCYVVVRRDRRRGLAVFASLLYISNPDLLVDHLDTLGWHLLRKHGLLCTLVEVRLLGRRPAGSIELGSPRPKMFRSRRLPPAVIDNLYSELTLVAW